MVNAVCNIYQDDDNGTMLPGCSYFVKREDYAEFRQEFTQAVYKGNDGLFETWQMADGMKIHIRA